MRVGFFTVYRRDPVHYRLADVLVRSVRTTMPGVEIIQFTDEVSPAVEGVDDVRRKPHGRMLERRLEHYSDCFGEWLLVDTDVMLQRDVRPVFFEHERFDVALADRNWPHIPATPDLSMAMPYNTGVAFSRSQDFWREALAIWRGFKAEEQADWLSEQRAVAAAVRTGDYRVRVLPGAEFNYPPADANDPGIKAAAIVHYKGGRKAWMVRSRVA